MENALSSYAGNSKPVTLKASHAKQADQLPEIRSLDREMPKNGKYAVVHTGKEGNGEADDNINAKLWRSHLQDFLQ